MNRKLATDIDRALKDVAKGVEMFDDIYKKVMDADTAGKKEKAETELKTQIKKLQRTRDQIKTWISSEEIREKDALLTARRTIEIRMEQFKRAEKEAKTKAFSKEGLAQADKLDPEEQARQECRDWVNDALDTIREQREAVTADLEALQSKKGKKNKEELEEIQERLRQHTWHVYNLELVLRGLDNDVLDYHDIDAIKDEVEYYVSSNSDPDFINDDSIYESLELESKLGVLGKEVVGEVISTPAVVLDEKEKVNAITAKIKKKTDESAEEAAKQAELERKAKQDQLLKKEQERQRLINEREEARRRREQLKKESEEQALQQQQQTGAVSPQMVPASPGGLPVKTTAAAVVAGSQSSDAGSQTPDLVPAVAPPSSAAAIIAKAVQQPQALERQRSAEQAPAPSPLGGVQRQSSAVPLAAPEPSVPSESVPRPWPQLDVGQRLALFDASLAFIPKEVDSERSRMYVPQNPAVDIPASFPTSPALRFENPQAFETMDLDTLFFIFFNQPGTYQQFLAGRELKKQDWRFHKQHGVWLQRHEDPSVTTNEFELGTYMYFDPISWSQKVKTNFNVEYAKLEL